MAEDTVQIQKKQKRRKVLILIGVVVVVLVAAGAAGAWYWSRDNNNGQSTNEEETPSGMNTDISYELKLEQLEPEQLHEKVDQFTYTGQYNEAAQLIEYQDYFSDSSDAHMLLASVYLNAGRPEQALETFEQMEDKFGLTKGIAENIGDLAAEIGNKELAVEYYEKAIELAQNPENPLAEVDAEKIRKKIDEL